MNKTIISSAAAPAPIGPYNQAIQSGNLLFISGQICIDSSSGELKNKDIKEETAQVMNNLKTILTAASMDFRNVVKTTIFLTDMKEFASVNEVYGSFFTEADIYPARETVQVSALPRFVNVEISMIAMK